MSNTDAIKRDLIQSITLVDAAKQRALAEVIANLIEEHEPLLRVERAGVTMIVREIGGSGVMRVTVGDGERE